MKSYGESASPSLKLSGPKTSKEYIGLIFYASEIEDQGHIVFVLSVFLSFCHLPKNFKTWL
jgi:hypothetical protein